MLARIIQLMPGEDRRHLLYNQKYGFLITNLVSLTNSFDLNMRLKLKLLLSTSQVLNVGVQFRKS